MKTCNLLRHHSSNGLLKLLHGIFHTWRFFSILLHLGRKTHAWNLNFPTPLHRNAKETWEHSPHVWLPVFSHAWEVYLCCRVGKMTSICTLWSEAGPPVLDTATQYCRKTPGGHNNALNCNLAKNKSIINSAKFSSKVNALFWDSVLWPLWVNVCEPWSSRHAVLYV